MLTVLVIFGVIFGVGMLLVSLFVIYTIIARRGNTVNDLIDLNDLTVGMPNTPVITAPITQETINEALNHPGNNQQGVREGEVIIPPVINNAEANQRDNDDAPLDILVNQPVQDDGLGDNEVAELFGNQRLEIRQNDDNAALSPRAMLNRRIRRTLRLRRTRRLRGASDSPPAPPASGRTTRQKTRIDYRKYF